MEATVQNLPHSQIQVKLYFRFKTLIKNRGGGGALISRGTYNGLEAAVYGLAYLHSFPNGRYGGRSQVFCSSRASASIGCRMSYRSHCTLDLDTMDIDHYIHSDQHTHYMLCRLQIEGIAR